MMNLNNTMSANFFNQTPVLNRFDILVKTGQLADCPIPVGCTDPHALKLGCKVIDSFNNGSFTLDDVFADNLPINHPFAQIKKEMSDHNFLANAGWRNQSVELHTLDQSTGVVRFKFVSRDESVAEGFLTSRQPSNFFFDDEGNELNRRQFLEKVKDEFSHAIGNTSDDVNEISSYPQTPSDSEEENSSSSSESELQSEENSSSDSEDDLSSVEDYDSDDSNDNGGTAEVVVGTGSNGNTIIFVEESGSTDGQGEVESRSTEQEVGNTGSNGNIVESAPDSCADSSEKKGTKRKRDESDELSFENNSSKKSKFTEEFESSTNDSNLLELGEGEWSETPTVSEDVIQEASNTESSDQSIKANNSLMTNEDSVSDTITNSSLLADIEYLEILSDVPSLFEGAAY